jgi:hypothetical protein
MCDCPVCGTPIGNGGRCMTCANIENQEKIIRLMADQNNPPIQVTQRYLTPEQHQEINKEFLKVVFYFIIFAVVIIML